MKKLIKTLSILMMSAMLILPAAVSTQAEEVNNNTKEVVEYSTRATKTIKGNGVYLRKGPSTSSASLGQLNYGDTVDTSSVVYDASGRKWYRCKVISTKSGKLDGLEGYVAAQYID